MTDDKQLKSKAIKIQGKDYVQVKDRISFFNDNFENGKIETKIIRILGDVVVVKATVTPDCNKPERFFTGISASNPAKSIEKTSPYEIAETSAVGRALAMMGIGIIDSVASADEMVKAGVPTPPTPPQPKLDDTLTSRCLLHDAPMTQQISKKTNKPYWSHKTSDGFLCFGKEQK